MATVNKDNKVSMSEKNNSEKEIQELRDMMKAKEAENEELRNMIKELSNIVKATNAGTSNVQKKEEQYDEELVYINNNSIGSQVITIDRLGNTSLKILPNEKNRPLEKEFVRQAIQINKVRRLFEYGILEFCDSKFYKIYGIERKFDMSEENVLKMFSKDNLSVTSAKLTEMLKRPDASALEHELAYKALDLYDRNLFPKSDIDTITLTLNKIFCNKVNYNFEDLRANLPYKRGDYR